MAPRLLHFLTDPGYRLRGDGSVHRHIRFAVRSGAKSKGFACFAWTVRSLGEEMETNCELASGDVRGLLRRAWDLALAIPLPAWLNSAPVVDVHILYPPLWAAGGADFHNGTVGPRVQKN